MILDANVLLYAVDDSSPHHSPAKAFLEEHLNGETRVGLPWQSIGAFLRISTHPRVMTDPLTPEAAAAHVDAWLNAAPTWIPTVDAGTWVILRRLVATHAITGNLMPDAQLAALAVQYGTVVVSADSDFARFPEAGWINPLSPA